MKVLKHMNGLDILEILNALAGTGNQKEQRNITM